MSILKKIVALAALFILFQVAYSGELGVESIEVVEEDMIRVQLSENPNLEVGEIDAEITILHDVSVKGGFTSELSPNQVEVLLHDSIKGNTSYSLLSVSGSDGSIDFTTEENVVGTTYQNLGSTLDSGIEEVKVIDDTTLMVTYADTIGSSVVEYKLLAENKVRKVEKRDYYEPELEISVEEKFLSEKDYILMFIELQDIDGNYLEFDTGIYDFTTPSIDSLYEGYMTTEDEVKEEQENEIDEFIGSIIGDEDDSLVDTDTITKEASDLAENVTESVSGAVDSVKDSLNGSIDGVMDSMSDLIAMPGYDDDGETQDADIDLFGIEGASPKAVESDGELIDEEPQDNEDTIPLEAAPEEISLQKGDTVEGDIEEVALLADQTPDTGAATWIIVAITIFINTFFYLSRRKRTTA